MIEKHFEESDGGCHYNRNGLWAFFVDARTSKIEQNIFMSNFIHAASLASSIRYVRFKTFVLRNPMSFYYFDSSTASAS